MRLKTSCICGRSLEVEHESTFYCEEQIDKFLEDHMDCKTLTKGDDDEARDGRLRD